MKTKTKKQMQSEFDNYVKISAELLTKYENEISELNKANQSLDKEVKSRREQITDINQWSTLLLNNRPNLRPRIMWSMIADINNRTTD